MVQSSWENFFESSYNNLELIRYRYAKTFYNHRLFITSQQELINFVSNDYLGLNNHPYILKSLLRNKFPIGFGSTSAVTLCGYSTLHESLEKKLASLLEYDDCLLFPSGYQLNVGLYSAFKNSNTIIWFDRNIHASHVDGILLSKIKFYSFNHDEIDMIFEKIKNMPNSLHIIVTEGVFSMDGLCHYLQRLVNFKEQNNENVLLIMDDAHGFGALGTSGLGVVEYYNLLNKIDIFIGTLGKTLSASGAFVCANRKIIRCLAQVVRSYLFSTAISPIMVEIALLSLDLIITQYGKHERDKLYNNIIFFKELANLNKINILNSEHNFSQIQLIMFHNEELMLRMHKLLLNNNLYTGKIMYPTVSKGKPRLRISINSKHSKDDIAKLFYYLRYEE